MSHEETIYDICKKVNNDIESDFGGGCPVEKSFLMAYLVQNQKLKTYVEIGVYRGKSLFPVSYSIYLNGGKSYGIDPYTYDDAKEIDTPDGLQEQIDSFLYKLDFDQMYQNLIMYREQCGYGDNIKIIRQPSQEAITYFKENNIKIDLLHIDGNHDTKFVRQDFESYRDILAEGGFIVFDDINWHSVRPVYEEAKSELSTIFECEYYGILYKEQGGLKDFAKTEKLQKRLTAIHNRVQDKSIIKPDTLPLITVGILTYNHEKYIEKCLKSIIEQTGSFRCKVIILDDNSTDNTQKIIEDFLKNTPQLDNWQIDYIRNEENLGVIKSFCKLTSLIRASRCDFFTFCEGDDYYLTNNRLESHLALHLHNPELAISFNKLLLYFQDANSYSVYLPEFNARKLSTEDLAQDNKPGSLCASFYNATVLNYINDAFFDDMYAGDWIFCTFASQFGDIGHISSPMSVYRKHREGEWSGSSGIRNNRILLANIPKYNKSLNFLYDAELQTAYDCSAKYLLDNDSLEEYDLVVIDNIFPHPLSGFSYQEFTNILKEFKRSAVYTTGAFSNCLSKDPIENLIAVYKRKHPQISDRLFRLNETTVFRAKLLYGIFLNTAYHNLLCWADKLSTPFAFTLYPGGGFCLNDDKSDEMLKAVFASPWFRKVIVTQQITYDYLINKQLCGAEDIEYIFGVITDNKCSNYKTTSKQHFGIAKKTLDVCFVAHKYSKNGKDKGYDLFIETAKKMSKKYNDIAFHVVGPWEENAVDASTIKNLTFYGAQSPDWLKEFYKDKDIIISANIPFVLAKGAFDGFPTTTVTDASLHEVAMFCTDPLELNQGRFEDQKEIVLIKHSVDDIVKKIEYYHDNPQKLEDLAKNGKLKSESIYSYENQMAPRIKLLHEIVATSNEMSPKINMVSPATTSIPANANRPLVLRRMIAKVTPSLMRRAYRKSARIIKKLKQI